MSQDQDRNYMNGRYGDRTHSDNYDEMLGIQHRKEAEALRDAMYRPLGENWPPSRQYGMTGSLS